jgi:hypothetical protein
VVGWPVQPWFAGAKPFLDQTAQVLAGGPLMTRLENGLKGLVAGD